MHRLIIVPQYPTKLRYQEWWYSHLPMAYEPYFDSVVTLPGTSDAGKRAESSHFSRAEEAIRFEQAQIRQFMHLDLKSDDVLLLCDLSFPGLFTNILYHKRPKRCFAICHATSKNVGDYFGTDFRSKWLVESGHAQLFDQVFVATKYHAQKLGWSNISVVGLPLPPETLYRRSASVPHRDIDIVSVARPGSQKRTADMEEAVKRARGEIAIPPDYINNWTLYYHYLRKCDKMLITAQEETFGYQVVDALLNGCVPIAPNRCSYPELLPENFLYNNEEELFEKLANDVPEDHRPSISQLKLLEQCSCFFEETSRIMTRD